MDRDKLQLKIKDLFQKEDEVLEKNKEHALKNKDEENEDIEELDEEKKKKKKRKSKRGRGGYLFGPWFGGYEDGSPEGGGDGSPEGGGGGDGGGGE